LITRGEPKFENDVAPFDVAEIVKPLPECVKPGILSVAACVTMPTRGIFAGGCWVEACSDDSSNPASAPMMTLRRLI
jgi:hypothetical protein